MGKSKTVICVQCGHRDTDIYCSKCGHPLAVKEDQFVSVLKCHMVEYGYTDVASADEGGYNPRVSSIVSVLSETKTQTAGLLIFDRSNMRQMEIAILLQADHLTTEDLTDIHIELVHSFTPIIKLLEKERIKTIILRYIQIFEKSDAALPQLKEHRKNIVTFRVGASVELKPYFFDVLPEIRRVLGQSISYDLAFSDIVESSFDQLTYKPNLKESESLGNLLYSNFIEEPLQKFFDISRISMNILLRPMYYAAEVDRGHISLKDSFITIALMAFYGVFIENLLGIQELTSFMPGIPVIDDIIPFFILLFGTVVGAGIVQLIARLFRGKGSFQKTFIACVFLGVPFYIFYETVYSFYEKFTPNNSVATIGKNELNISNGIQAFYFAYLTPIISVIHRMSIRRSFWSMTIGTPLITLAIAGPIIFLFIKYTDTKNLDQYNYQYAKWSKNGSANKILYSEGAISEDELAAVNDSLENISWFVPKAPDSLARSIQFTAMPDSTIQLSIFVRDGLKFVPLQMYYFYILQGQVQRALPTDKITLLAKNSAKSVIRNFPEVAYLVGTRKHLIFYNPTEIKEEEVKNLGNHFIDSNFFTDAEQRLVMVRKKVDHYEVDEVTSLFNELSVQNIYKQDVKRFHKDFPNYKLVVHLCGQGFEDTKFVIK